MTEINNKLPHIGLNNIEYQTQKPAQEYKAPAGTDEEKQQDDIKDTGVLGRSQVRTANGADISKSVNSAVELAENNPALLNCSDKMFDEMYNQFLKQGMTEKDAYINACLAEGEFVETAQNR